MVFLKINFQVLTSVSRCLGGLRFHVRRRHGDTEVFEGGFHRRVAEVWNKALGEVAKIILRLPPMKSLKVAQDDL